MTGINKSDMPKTAMILAAGLGERMRPLTSHKPKALVEISGRPLIGHLLNYLEDLNLEKIVINIHYRGQVLKDWLKTHSLHERIIISDETSNILDTGGGIKKALPHLGSRPIYVANCDSFFPDTQLNPFEVLARAWKKENMDALLLLKETDLSFGYDGPGDFFRQPNGALLRPQSTKQEAPFAYTGLQILDPNLFNKETRKVFSLNSIFSQTLQKNRLYGTPYDKRWFHIGTPEALMLAEAKLKDGND